MRSSSTQAALHQESNKIEEEALILDDPKTPNHLSPKENQSKANSSKPDAQDEGDDIWRPGRDKVFHLHLPETHRKKWNLIGHLREFYVEEGRKKLEISWVDDRNYHNQAYKKSDRLIVPEKSWLKSHPNTKLWYELSERIEESKREQEQLLHPHESIEKVKIDPRPRSRWLMMMADPAIPSGKNNTAGTAEEGPRTNLEDAKTFLQHLEDRTKNQIYSTSYGGIQYENLYEAKDRAVKLIAEQLRHEIVTELSTSIVEEMFAYNTLALDFVGKGVLRGILNIDENNTRFLKASGKLLVLRGAMEDYCTNRNQCLGTDEIYAKELLESLRVQSITDLVRKLDRSLTQTLQEKPVPAQVRKKQKTKSTFQSKTLQPRIARHIQHIQFHRYDGYIDSRIVHFIQQMEEKHIQQLSAQVVEQAWDWPKEKFGRITATLTVPDYENQSTILIAGTELGRIYCWRIQWQSASQLKAASKSTPLTTYVGHNRKPAKEDRAAIINIQISPSGPRFLFTLNTQDHMTIWNLEEIFIPIVEEEVEHRRRGFFSCSIFPKAKPLLYIEKLFDFESAELSYQCPSTTLSSALFHENNPSFMDQVKKYFGKIEELDDRLPTAICFHAITNSRDDCTSVLVGNDDGMIIKINLDYIFQTNRNASIVKPCPSFVEKEFINPYVAPEDFLLRSSIAKTMTSNGLHANSSRPGNRVFREFLHFHKCKVIFIQVIDKETCDVLSMDEDGYIAIWKYDLKYFQNVGWFTPWKTARIDLEWIEYLEKDQDTESVDSKEHDEVIMKELRCERLVIKEEIVYPTNITIGNQLANSIDEEEEEGGGLLVPTLSLSLDAWDDGLGTIDSPMNSPGRLVTDKRKSVKKSHRKSSLHQASFQLATSFKLDEEMHLKSLDEDDNVASNKSSPRSPSKKRKSTIGPAVDQASSPSRPRDLNEDGETLEVGQNSSSKKSKTYFSKSPSMFRKSILLVRDDVSNNNSLDEGDAANALSPLIRSIEEDLHPMLIKAQNPKRIIKFTKSYQPILDEVNEEWVQYKVFGYIGLKSNPTKQRNMEKKDLHWEKLTLQTKQHKLKMAKNCLAPDGLDLVVMCQVLNSADHTAMHYVIRSLALPALSFRDHFIQCSFKKSEEVLDIACGSVMLETMTRLLFVLTNQGIRCFALTTGKEVIIPSLQSAWQEIFKKFVPKKMVLCPSQRVLFLYSAQQSKFETISITHEWDQKKIFIKDTDEDPRLQTKFTKLQEKIQEQNRILSLSSEPSSTSWKLMEEKLASVAKSTVLNFQVVTPLAEDISYMHDLIDEIIDLSIDESETKQENRQRRQRIIEVYGRDLGYIDPTKWPPVKYSKLQLQKQERKQLEAKLLKENRREQEQQLRELELMAKNDYRVLSNVPSIATSLPNLLNSLSAHTIPSPPKSSPPLSEAPTSPQNKPQPEEDTPPTHVFKFPHRPTTPKPSSR